jgi:uncharacterized protein (UPF0548 family)
MAAPRAFWLARPSEAVLAARAASQADAPFTHGAVSATRGELPPGYRHDHWTADLGEFTEERFGRAASALRRWEVQRGAGITVFPGDEVVPGAAFILVLALPVGFVTAPGRVVYVIDEPFRSGFAYGTLAGHPEQGEESFTVFRRGDRISFEITAFSRPAHPLARIASPVARWLQVRTTKAYLGAMRRAIA